MPKKKVGTNSSPEWAELCQAIRQLLHDCPSGIALSAFWTEFQKAHKFLPEPKKFGVNKRGALLDKCTDVCEVKTQRGVVTVFPKSARPKESRSAELTSKQPLQDQAVRDGEEDNMHPRGRSVGSYYSRQEPYPALGAPCHSYQQQHHQVVAGRPAANFYDQYAAVNRYNEHTDSQRSGSGDRGRHHHQSHGAHSSSYGHDRRDYQHQDRNSRQSHRTVPEQQLNSVAEDCIERLAESKAYVSVERIEKLVLQHFKADNLQDIGVRQLDNIKTVHEHVRVQCKVNAYIQGFIKVRSIATVWELGQCLREYVPNKQDFEHLHLGPLVKQPLVYEFFKMPQDAEIPEISTEHILEGLRDYLTEKNLWTNKGLELEDFLKHLTEKRQLEHPYLLGVRIRSLPLAVGVSALFCTHFKI